MVNMKKILDMNWPSDGWQSDLCERKQILILWEMICVLTCAPNFIFLLPISSIVNPLPFLDPFFPFVRILALRSFFYSFVRSFKNKYVVYRVRMSWHLIYLCIFVFLFSFLLAFKIILLSPFHLSHFSWCYVLNQTSRLVCITCNWKWHGLPLQERHFSRII